LRAGLERTDGERITAGIIVADVVGGGILGMPLAMASVGWMLGAAVLAAMLAANVRVSMRVSLVRVSCRFCGGAQTYRDLSKGAIDRASARQWRAANDITGVSQYTFMFAILGIYLLSAGRGLGMLFHASEVCLPQRAAVAALLLLPFASTGASRGRRRGRLAARAGGAPRRAARAGRRVRWQALRGAGGRGGAAAVGGGGLLSPAAAAAAAAAAAREAVALAERLPCFAGCRRGRGRGRGDATARLLGSPREGRRDPRELPKAHVGISAPFQLAAVALAGLGGYFLWGKAVGRINENLPFNAGFQAAAACLRAHMLVSYLIKGVVSCRAIPRKAAREYADPNDQRDSFSRGAVRAPPSIRGWRGVSRWDV